MRCMAGGEDARPRLHGHAGTLNGSRGQSPRDGYAHALQVVHEDAHESTRGRMSDTRADREWHHPIRRVQSRGPGPVHGAQVRHVRRGDHAALAEGLR